MRSASPNLDTTPARQEIHACEEERDEAVRSEKMQATPGQPVRGLPWRGYPGIGLLPAGPQDQRDCCGHNRKQRNQTGGLGVTGLDRPSGFLNQFLGPTGPSPPGTRFAHLISPPPSDVARHEPGCKRCRERRSRATRGSSSGTYPAASLHSAMFVLTAKIMCVDRSLGGLWHAPHRECHGRLLSEFANGS
jgi:hypothetical protein